MTLLSALMSTKSQFSEIFLSSINCFIAVEPVSLSKFCRQYRTSNNSDCSTLGDGNKLHHHMEWNTVENRIKQPVFIRTLRLKFNLLNHQNKNPPGAETRRGSYTRGLMCSEFLRILKNSYILTRILQWYKRLNYF